MTNDDVAKDGIAFAIAYADNCVIPEGFANDKKYDNQDWMSDWAAYLAEAVWAELHRRGFKILRPLKTPGELLDEIVRLRKALESIAEAKMPGEARRIAFEALREPQ